MKFALDDDTVLVLSGVASSIYGLQFFTAPKQAHEFYYEKVVGLWGAMHVVPRGLCMHSHVWLHLVARWNTRTSAGLRPKSSAFGGCGAGWASCKPTSTHPSIHQMHEGPG